MNQITRLLMIGMLVLLSACGTKEAEIKAEQEPPGPPLQVNDLKEGTGDPAQTGDTVLVHYTGWLYVNGERTTQFDTSRAADRGLFEVTIGETPVIKGWTQGLVGMKVSGVRQLIIPPQLAYGEAGKGPIPPSSTLEFEIELHGIVKPK
jgi:FKBP-type peptidyl-prolyl cis-trans isomerase